MGFEQIEPTAVEFGSKYGELFAVFSREPPAAPVRNNPKKLCGLNKPVKTFIVVSGPELRFVLLRVSNNRQAAG